MGEKRSDKIYRRWRGKNIKLLTDDELIQYYKNINKLKKLCDDYWGNLPSDLRDKISSFDKHGDVMIVPADKPSPRGDLPQDKPPSNERNNLPSADKYTNEPSSILNTNGNLFSDKSSIKKHTRINNNNQERIESNKAYKKVGKRFGFSYDSPPKIPVFAGMTAHRGLPPAHLFCHDRMLLAGISIPTTPEL